MKNFSRLSNFLYDMQKFSEQEEIDNSEISLFNTSELYSIILLRN